MDLQKLVTRIKNADLSAIEDVAKRYDADSYGPMAKTSDDDGCSFSTGFVPQIGDILVYKDGAVDLVGTVNRSLGECSCCKEYREYDEYLGFIPASTWSVWLKTHDLP